MRETKSQVQGFTLIELMIVVAIIGILSAIAIPAYKNYIAKSEAATAVGTLRSLLTNIEMYQQENSNQFPTKMLDIGGSTKMNKLGDIVLSSANKTNTIKFTFTGGSLSSGGTSNAAATITFTKNNESGWTCSHSIADTTIAPKGC